MSFKNILCFGTLNPDLIYFIDKLPNRGDDIRSFSSKIRSGGTAINCSELIALWNKPVHVRGNSISNDPMGKYLINHLKENNIHPDKYIINEPKTVDNSLNLSGNEDFISYPSCSYLSKL